MRIDAIVIIFTIIIIIIISSSSCMHLFCDIKPQYITAEAENS